MKVLIVNTLYHPHKIGGAEISVQVLAESLQKKRIKVAILTLGENNDELVINNIPIYRLKIENILWPFDRMGHSKIKKLKWHFTDIYNKKYNIFFNEIIDKFNPDVIHTNNLIGFSVAIWDVASKKKIKIVHTLRDYYLQCPKTNKFKNGSVCIKQCLECILFSQKKKSVSQHVDSVVGISNSILKNHVDEGYFKTSAKKIIYNGFKIRKETSIRANFDKDSFLKFGYIGQVNKAKGIEILMRNLAELIDYDNWKLYVAGHIDLAYKNHLLSFLPSQRVEFMGYTKRETFFKTINILVVPSLWEEPFGRVVLEGMLSNVVVLGSRRGGILEILNNNQKFTFNPLNEELGNLLQLILKTPEELNTFDFDLERLNKLFSIENMINGYLDIYNELND